MIISILIKTCLKEKLEPGISLDFVLRRENHMEGYFESQNSKRDAVKYPTFSLSIWLNISIFPSSHNNEISHQNIEKHGENLRKGVVEWN